MILWGLLLGAALLVVAGWFMHRYAQEGNASEIVGFPARVIITFVLLGLVVVVYRLMGPILTLFLVLVVAPIIGILWIPTLVSLVLNPLSGSLTGGSEPVEARPYYSRALGLRKRGEYEAALEAIQRELTRFPEDTEGRLLLAQILAENLKQPEAAADELRLVADSPGRPAEERCLALNQLADLQWKHLNDPAGARTTWETVIAEFSDTTAAHLARQRLAHLGEGAAESPAETRRLIVKEHHERLGLTEDLGASRARAEEDPNQAASQLLRHLEEHPQDWEARERLARLYMEALGRLDLATDQLERLLAEPNVPVRHVVRWYHELADLQLKAPDGVPAARLTLERLVARLPETSHATQAEARLRHLVWDEKAKKAPRTIKLGRYENNLGLRRKESDSPDADQGSTPGRGGPVS